MCAIFGSFDPVKCGELRNLNAYRGEISGSIALLSEDMFGLNRFPGKIPDDLFTDVPGSKTYQLGHVQAPTTEAEISSSIHPAFSRKQIAAADDMHVEDYFLWHNGIIKQHEMDRINKWCGTKYVWDTKLLVDFIQLFGFGCLSDIDGCFSCFMTKQSTQRHDLEAFVFRNEISPMFVDDDLNLSSTKFEGSRSTEAGVVYQFDFSNRKLVDTGQRFKTKENPYYFG